MASALGLLNLLLLVVREEKQASSVNSKLELKAEVTQPGLIDSMKSFDELHGDGSSPTTALNIRLYASRYSCSMNSLSLRLELVGESDNSARQGLEEGIPYDIVDDHFNFTDFESRRGVLEDLRAEIGEFTSISTPTHQMLTSGRSLLFLLLEKVVCLCGD